MNVPQKRMIQGNGPIKKLDIVEEINIFKAEVIVK